MYEDVVTLQHFVLVFGEWRYYTERDTGLAYCAYCGEM